MEKYRPQENIPTNTEVLERSFKYYLKDLPLTEEELQKPLLDVGTGRGEFVKYLREIIGNREAVGVDYQSSKIDRTYKGLIVADGMNLPFKEKSFDTVTAHNYLPMFVSNPIKMQAAIEELLRVVKKGGRVMGDIHTPESIISVNDELRKNMGENYTERDQILFEESFQGAEKLQEYLKQLNPDEAKVEFSGLPEKTVVVITKL